MIPWATLFWVFFRQQVYRPGDVYLVAGDEAGHQSGKHTHGLDRFFVSLYGKPVPGLAFFTLSLVSVPQRRSFPLCIEQVVRAPTQRRLPARPKRLPESLPGLAPHGVLDVRRAVQTMARFP